MCLSAFWSSAPCSGASSSALTSDIEWTRIADLEKFLHNNMRSPTAAAQPTLAAGGQLLMQLSSIFVAENEAVVERFLARRPGAIALY